MLKRIIQHLTNYALSSGMISNPTRPTKALFCVSAVYNFLSKNPNPTCNKLTLSPAAKRARREDDAGADGRIVAQVNDMKVRVLEH